MKPACFKTANPKDKALHIFVLVTNVCCGLLDYARLGLQQYFALRSAVVF